MLRFFVYLSIKCFWRKVKKLGSTYFRSIFKELSVSKLVFLVLESSAVPTSTPWRPESPLLRRKKGTFWMESFHWRKITKWETKRQVSKFTVFWLLRIWKNCAKISQGAERRSRRSTRWIGVHGKKLGLKIEGWIWKNVWKVEVKNWPFMLTKKWREDLWGEQLKKEPNWYSNWLITKMLKPLR